LADKRTRFVAENENDKNNRLWQEIYLRGMYGCLI